MGFLKKTGTIFIYIGATLAFITFLPGLPPNVEFTEYSITSPEKLEGNLAINDRLNDAEKLFVGELKGSESFDSYDGQLYSGLHGGYVVRYEGNKIVAVVKFGKKCDGLWQEHKCGRPLGLKFDKKGSLYVSDAYYGIFKVDVKTGKYKLLVNSSQPIDGKIPHIPNSLDIAENGDIYWTDSSTEFKLYDGLYTLLTNPSGRLIRYNVITKKNEVLLKDLAFGNGIQLSKDQSFLIVAETVASRIMKYNLRGPKAGKAEVFYAGLPGMPDNIHSDGKDGFLVALIAYADSEHPDLVQSITPHPYIRKMLVRLLKCIEMPFLLIQDFYPNVYAEKLIHMVGSFESVSLLMMPRATILRLDVNGKIIEAAYTTDEKLSGISSGFVHNNYLWLGSPFVEYVARVPLKQAFPDLAQSLASEPVQRKQAPHASQSVPVKKSAPKETPSSTDTPPVAKPGSTQAGRGSEAEQVRKPREAKVAENVKPATKPVAKAQATVPPTPPPANQTPKPVKKVAAQTTTPTTTTTTPKPTAKPTAKPAAKPTQAPSAAANAKTQGSPTKEVKKEATKVETPKLSTTTKQSETPEKMPAVKPTDTKPVDAKTKQFAGSAKQSRQNTESKPAAKPAPAKNRPADEF